ncbi:MAG TPA: hypothetical protein VK094_00235 [Pseudogracilibacillus sp.]|nr:hypothetical protein [Pseudogracilibacillus sp.]
MIQISKERLEINHAIEVIKRETVIAKGLNNSNYNVSLPIDLAVILIEQAERVEYLEKEYKVRRVCYLEEHIDRLEKELNNYRGQYFKTQSKLRDFRKEANIIQGFSRERIISRTAFDLSCDIRDLMVELGMRND